MPLNRQKYIDLLSRMIACSKNLQNNPPELIPQEGLIADIVVDYLEDSPHISIQRVEYVPGRANLVLTYCAQYAALTSDRVMSFVGSLDVFPANEKEWKHNPFVMTVEDDIFHGRGTTDCLNHVALMTILLKEMSEQDIKLDYRLVVVFIADEENGVDPNIGIEHLMKDGYLDRCKGGPLYWLNLVAIYPLIGCGTRLAFALKITGKLACSGYPQDGINAILLGGKVVEMMITEFNKLYPEHPNDKIYDFEETSNIKATKVIMDQNSAINQIPQEVIYMGDARLTPFYNGREVMQKIQDYVNGLNDKLEEIPICHPSFKNIAKDGTRAKIEFKWHREPVDGLACDLNSIGFKLLSDVTFEMTGKRKTFTTMGSLPLISDLKKAGFDVQIVGYGVPEAYHANNEYCRFSDMELGYNIISKVIERY